MTHDLKCYPEFFRAVATGQKTFELRRDDRPYFVGDRLLLREYDPAKKTYSGQSIVMRVTYLLMGGNWPYEAGQAALVFGWIIMGIVRADRAPVDHSEDPEPMDRRAVIGEEA